MLLDLKYGLRLLFKTPVVTAAAVLTLALGIGANAAVFSVVEATFLRALPFPDSGRMVQVERRFPTDVAPNTSVPQYVFWRDHSDVFETLCAYDWLELGFNLTEHGDPLRLAGTRVTASFFDTFAVRPALGRTFNEQEDQPSGPLAVILSDGLWKELFASDRDALGESLRLNGQPHEIIGVMPPGFRYPATAQLWVPLQPDSSSTDRQAYLQVTGKLRAGITSEQAMAEVTAANDEYLSIVGTVADGELVSLRPPQTMLFGELRSTLLIVTAVAAFVLLIACGNVASLQLARGAERTQEIALRRSVGAPAARIVRQLLTESLLLAALGGTAGLLLALGGLRLVVDLIPASSRPLAAVGLNVPVLLFAALVTVGVGTAVGLLPALRARRTSAASQLNDSTSRIVAGGRLRQVVVGTQIALTVVALIGAGLFIRSFLLLVNRDVGLTAEGVLTAHLPMAAATYDGPEDWQGLSDRLVEVIAALPGVEATAAATNLPMARAPGMTFVIEGAPAPATDEDVPAAHYRPGTSAYFATFGIDILRGREFDDGDRFGSAAVVIINERAADLYWPGQDALGAQITIGPPVFPPPFHDPSPRTVVGVVANVLEEGLDSVPEPVLYVPLGQVPAGLMRRYVSLLPLALAIRTTGPPEQFLPALRRSVLAHDPNQPLMAIDTLEDYLRGTVADREAIMRLLVVFGILALFLAMIGVYGVASYTVQQRTREIGVRVALGAGSAHIRKLVLGQGLVAISIGVAGGTLAALALGDLAASLVFGVGTRDPLILVAVPTLMLGVAAAAMLIPVARALRVDPVRVLRGG